MTDEEVMQLAQNAASFVAHPFWEYWLNYAKREADIRLGQVRDALSSDDRVVRTLRDRWRSIEEVFAMMQSYPYNCIEAGREAEQNIRNKLIAQAKGNGF